MKAIITGTTGQKEIDFSTPIGIHLSLQDNQTLGAWYVDPPSIKPHREGNFIGSIEAGAPVNFNDISFNPHAHGTHTECVGHILAGDYQVLNALKNNFFETLLITVAPVLVKGDLQITKDQLIVAIGNNQVPESLVVRTLPNTTSKAFHQYSYSNPPYLSQGAAIFIRELGVQHLLVDLPSIDKEEDQGTLEAHKAFWNVDGNIRTEATITEFIFVPDTVLDGSYLLQIGLAPFVNDATPSTVYLYEFKNLL